jgi:quercetin 2,3-dioxygenase
VIAGDVEGTQGPIVQPATDPLYLDIELAPGARFSQPLPAEYAAFVYVFEGSVRLLGDGSGAKLDAHQLAVLSAGDRVELEGAANHTEAARAILVAGKPLREPVAKYGPFVMNTREELLRAFEDLQNGRF